jgi:hypothetical protein
LSVVLFHLLGFTIFFSDLTQNTSDGKSGGARRKLSIAFRVSSGLVWRP